MILNSVTFGIFFLTFFLIYWLIANKSLKAQNLFILFASYVFYAWTDWRFLSYIVGISILNFYLGIYIDKSRNPRHKQIFLYIALLQGIGGLLFFKYFNFFISSFQDAFQLFGINLGIHALHIIIPLGISFFTFKTLSYVLDIYNEEIQPCTDWIVFLSYVSFFPTLLAGPIDRAKTFIPQLQKKRVFDYSQIINGLRQILCGLFKKAVIADNCSVYTNQIFSDYHNLPASSLLVGAFLYAIEIYADFSGYSDMAIGFSRLLGFKVTRNFNYPFFAQNISEFWRKWHMSLTTWLTDYVFTPLNFTFRRYGTLGLIMAIIINFTICGIWHGANWTFLLYGFLHGCYFIPLILRGNLNKKEAPAKGNRLPSFREFANILGTFTLVMLTLIIFRSNSITEAFQYYISLFSLSLFSLPIIDGANIRVVLFLILVLLLVEWLQKDKEYALQISTIGSMPIKWSIYYTLIFCIVKYGGVQASFIYAQF